MGLSQYIEVKIGEIPGYIANYGDRASLIKNEMKKCLISKNFNDFQVVEEVFQKKNYLVGYKNFGKGERAAYAFYFGDFNNTDLIFETRYFESSLSKQRTNRATSSLGMAGNIIGGFLSPHGRSFSDEKKLIKMASQSFSGGGPQELNDLERQQSLVLLQVFLSDLTSIIDKYTSKN
ncbi:hypothetical protein [Pelolinea submarina]|uniref:Uncharacterized protein n=1 Tax=Pelolinea submarina TaxID=913107 RepID=A0A3E0AHG8_9CHLR|nr:hypothetical protein [Pelolinea submarina]REG11128.1 hypothetical protein DFR64_1003 [Pelolinea submarina]